MPSPDFQVIQWVKRIKTRLNPEWKGEYKPLLILSVLELLNVQPDHPNRFEYSELLDLFKKLIAERGVSQVVERQFSNPYIRLRSDQEPIQVWIPQASENIDIETIDPANPASVRRGVPYIKINDDVWSSFQSESVRNTIREKIDKRLSSSNTQRSLFEQTQNDLGLEEETENDFSEEANNKEAGLTNTDILNSGLPFLSNDFTQPPEGLEAFHSEVPIASIYSIEECAGATYLPIEELKQWAEVTERKRQVIFYGPPGTGKTFVAEHLARHLSGGQGFYETVQFHPAYTYEDFIQGIRPVSKSGILNYPYINGRFLSFCEKANKYQGACILVIDEMNRANLSQVFGELMYLLEYRNKQIPLASGKLFSIPENVFIIGTMNTADRSIALIDYALRRRFAFIALRPDYGLLERYHASHILPFSLNKLIGIINAVNREIDDPNYEIGVSFFLSNDLAEKIEIIWKTEIEPYLEECFFAQRSDLEQFKWSSIKAQLEL